MEFVSRCQHRLHTRRPSKCGETEATFKFAPLRLLRLLVLVEAAYFGIKSSVAADIPWLLFLLVFSLVQIPVVWMSGSSPYWDDSGGQSAVGFGQMMAYFLLALPLITLVEIFTGESIHLK